MISNHTENYLKNIFKSFRATGKQKFAIFQYTRNSSIKRSVSAGLNSFIFSLMKSLPQSQLSLSSEFAYEKRLKFYIKKTKVCINGGAKRQPS